MVRRASHWRSSPPVRTRVMSSRLASTRVDSPHVTGEIRLSEVAVEAMAELIGCDWNSSANSLGISTCELRRCSRELRHCSRMLGNSSGELRRRSWMLRACSWMLRHRSGELRRCSWMLRHRSGELRRRPRRFCRQQKFGTDGTPAAPNYFSVRTRYVPSLRPVMTMLPSQPVAYRASLRSMLSNALTGRWRRGRECLGAWLSGCPESSRPRPHADASMPADVS